MQYTVQILVLLGQPAGEAEVESPLAAPARWNMKKVEPENLLWRLGSERCRFFLNFVNLLLLLLLLLSRPVERLRRRLIRMERPVCLCFVLSLTHMPSSLGLVLTRSLRYVCTVGTWVYVSEGGREREMWIR